MLATEACRQHGCPNSKSERLPLGLRLISTLLHKVAAHTALAQEKAVPGLDQLTADVNIC